MTTDTLDRRARRAGAIAIWLGVAICLATLTLVAGAQAPSLDSGDKWVEALAEARSVQKVMSYAIVSLSLALCAVSGYVVKLLAGVVREATAEMRLCRERHEKERGK